MDGFTHSYPDIPCMMYPAKIASARLYISLETSVE